MSLAAQPARQLTRDEALDAVRAGATLVTGNDRLARGLREAFNAKMVAAGAKAWPSPRIHSWNVWMDRLWSELERRSPEPPPIRLTADQERLAWERAVGRDPQDRPLLAGDATAEAARQAAKLAVEWRLDRAEIEAADSAETQSFVRWRADVERLYERRGWIGGPEAVDAIAARLAELQPEQLLLAGFDERTPQQRGLLDALRAAGGSVHEVAPRPHQDRRAVRVAFESRREELRAAARWARKLLEGGAEVKIGVVVPDLGERRQEVERLFLEELDPAGLLLDGKSEAPGFTISAGLPLDRCALVRAALLALQMRPDGTELGVFGAWLRSDAVAGGAAERSARGLLDRKLREKGNARIRPRKLGKRLRDTPELRQSIARWMRRHARLPERQAPARWAESFAGLLDALGWPGEASADREGQQTLEKWRRLLVAFAGLGAVADEWDLETAVRQLRRMARATPFQPNTPHAQVEIMSLLESAGAEVDHAWIAGLDDESWPEEPQPNPFLPIGLQRKRGLPRSSAERALELARRETGRLLAMAPDIVVSHATATDDHKLSPSPLITQLDETEARDVVGEPEPPLVRRLWDPEAVERIPDAAGPALPPGEATVGGTKVFEHQAHCPFRAFAELRLGARALETASPGLAPWERGQLVHKALERIWEDLQTSVELRRRNPGELQRTVAEGVEHALRRLVEERREPLPPRFESVERSRLEELLFAWLETEKELRKDDFTVVGREAEQSFELAGVRAELRVDRVDELADGRRIVVDYKTGKVTVSEWDRERPLEPQLPLYAISQGEKLAGAVFARLGADALKFEGALASDVRIDRAMPKKAPELAGRVEQWRENLEALARDYLAGRAEVDPRDGKCGYCKLPTLCRKDEAE